MANSHLKGNFQLIFVNSFENSQICTKSIDYKPLVVCEKKSVFINDFNNNDEENKEDEVLSEVEIDEI